MQYYNAYVQVKGKSSEAGNLDVPKRNHKVLPLIGKVKVLGLIRRERILYAEVAI